MILSFRRRNQYVSCLSLFFVVWGEGGVVVDGVVVLVGVLLLRKERRFKGFGLLRGAGWFLGSGDGGCERRMVLGREAVD